MEKRTFPEDEQLLNYLDGTLDALQAKEIEQRVKLSLPLQTRLEELRAIHHTLLSNGALEMPSDAFTQRVMRNLDSFQVQNISAKNGILLLLGILTAIGVALLLLQSGIFDSANGAITIGSLPIKKEWLKSPIPAIPFNGKMIVNIILIVVTGLSFVLLDRTILRPWFEQRARVNG